MAQAGRLMLRDEDPNTVDVRHALRCIDAYRELQSSVDEGLMGSSDGSADRDVLEVTSARIAGRLAFWKARRDFLLAHTEGSWPGPDRALEAG